MEDFGRETRDSLKKEESRREPEEKERSRKEDSRASDRDGDRHRDRDREKGREREKEKLREREHERDRDRDRQRQRERERPKESRRQEKEREAELEGEYRHKSSKEREKRDKYRDDRERDGERSRDREKDELREREKVKEKEKERKRREVERPKERERRDSERDRDRDWKDVEDERDRKRRKKDEDSGRTTEPKDREKIRDRERQRDREPERQTDKTRDRSKDDDDDRDRDRKRRRKDEDFKLDSKLKKEEEEDLDEEQRKLDEEMEKRRRRVQEWQELRRRKEEEERKKRGDAADAVELVANSGKAWTLEGEESDDEDIPKTEDGLKSKGAAVSVVAAFENGDVFSANTHEDMAIDSKTDHVMAPGKSLNRELAKNEEEEEVDPLDAFMNSVVLPEVEKLTNEDESRAEMAATPVTKEEPKTKEAKPVFGGKQLKKPPKNSTGRIIPGEDSESDEEGEEREGDDVDEDDDEFMKRVKKSKAEKLAIVDHSKIQYPPFRKNFYIEVKEITKMNDEEVSAYRRQLELKLRGKDVPRPVKTWNQTGLSSKILDVIKKLGFEKPMPIQAQSIPIIMSGRDCIGIAKTGSGKTLAFVLPLMRHIMDQPPLVSGDGPIGLIMAPTRELVQQIYNDIKKFSKVLGLSCVPVYGGSGVAQQISDLKRGTEIVVCTPGRMIDILCTSAGKITNLRRVTYLVMDEADRMFDMGFEPQITRIVQNTRPDRQTVLFSATFPRQVEVLARKVLNKPVEIQVGGRSVVNKDITQTIEVRPDGQRFLRLLELLGEWYEKGKILIFVHSQDKCDSLFKDLLRAGYPCLSLHGAKDQTDRESTITDFKSNVCSLLVATSVAARGLDVKELELVVNFDVPNHYEDYVHRVGRTGRAGRKGFAVTFISEDEDRYAPDLVKALELSEQPVPEDLKKLAEGFMAKVNQGTEQAHGSGYGGSGFKFTEEEDEARKAAKKAQAKEYGFEEDEDRSDSDSDDGIRKAGGDLAQAAAAAALAVAAKAGLSVPGSVGQPALGAMNPQLLAMAQALPGVGLPGTSLPGITAVAGMPNMTGLPNMAAMAGSSGIPTIPGLGLSGLGLTAGVSPSVPNEGAARAAALAAALNLQHNLAKIQADAIPEHYEAELEINDFPQHARWKVTHKDSLGPISEWTGAAITTRGQFFPPGKVPAPGERKLYLFIEGPTEASVKKAKAEIKRILEESTSAAISLPSGGQPGKYSVL